MCGRAEAWRHQCAAASHFNKYKHKHTCSQPSQPANQIPTTVPLPTTTSPLERIASSIPASLALTAALDLGAVALGGQPLHQVVDDALGRVQRRGQAQHVTVQGAHPVLQMCGAGMKCEGRGKGHGRARQDAG